MTQGYIASYVFSGYVQSEWGCIAYSYGIHHMCYCCERDMFTTSKWGLVTCPKPLVRAWSLEWELGVHRDWDPVRMKN